MPPKKAGAIFDVRPVDQAGRLDVPKIENVAPQLNLRGVAAPRLLKPLSADSRPPLNLAQRPTALPAPAILATYDKNHIRNELERSLNTDRDVSGIVGTGVIVQHPVFPGKPRYRPVRARRAGPESLFQKILSEIYTPLRHHEPAPTPRPVVSKTVVAAKERTAALENWYGVSASPVSRTPRPALPVLVPATTRTFLISEGKRRRMWRLALGLAAVLAVAGSIFAFMGGRAIQEGKAAVMNLETAKTNLEQFDFGAASENFMLAYQEFSRAGESMSILGGNIGALLGELPGAGKLKSANDLIEAGKLIAQAGQAMADIVKVIARTGVVLNPNSNSRVLTVEILTPLNKALQLTDTNLDQAALLVNGIDASVIPEDKRETFGELVEKLPEFQRLVDEGIEFTKFFESFVAGGGSHTYLLLFQNSSELRPTGGFPGSYGVFTLENGRVKQFSADDVYDIDGQMPEVIVPPLQLQHITPNWAMRDAAWFIDFPTSARKVLEFYKKESRQDAEGVITINPQIMAELLNVIGPIPMPEYGVTLTGENFLSAVQSEVEYGDNKKINQPKKIIIDLAPLFIQKLHSAPREKWLEIFNVFVAAMERKDLLMYFEDPKLQKFVYDKKFAGQVISTPGDYLMVTFSNVKGAKTDAVTDSSLKMHTVLAGGTLTHKLTITRRHDGGKNKFGFYNKQNPAYVRVLVPQGSELIDISGNSKPSFAPLLNYPKTDFKRDPDLERFEKTGRKDSAKGITTYQESGKTEFGFWMIVDPGEIKTVELEYRVPAELAKSDYKLYVQKQPGLELSNFEFDISVPDGTTVKGATPVLTGSRGNYGFVQPLDKDLPIEVTFE